MSVSVLFGCQQPQEVVITSDAVHITGDTQDAITMQNALYAHQETLQRYRIQQFGMFCIFMSGLYVFKTIVNKEKHT